MELGTTNYPRSLPLVQGTVPPKKATWGTFLHQSSDLVPVPAVETEKKLTMAPDYQH